MSELIIQVIHPIPLNLGKVETIEISQGKDFKGSEWRYLDDKGVMVYQSKKQYGNTMAALRDGLVTIIGLPNDSTIRNIEQVRKIINAHF